MVDVYKLMSPGVSEEMRSGIHDVTRLHTNNVDYQYQLGLSATSGDFQKWCAGNNVTQSMGEVGVCWDCEMPSQSRFSRI